MNRVRQSSGGSAQEMRPPDQQARPSAFSPPPLTHVTSAVDQYHQPWQQLQQRHQQLQEQQQQYSQQRHQQQQLQDQLQQQQLQEQHQQYHHHHQQQQNQQWQQPRVSLPNDSFIPEAHSHLRNMPPDGSSTRSSLQENITSGGVEKDLSPPPDLSDSSSQFSSEESEERRETSSISYGSLPRPIRHHPTNGPLQMNTPRGYMQQSSYPHSLPPTMSASYTGRMDHGFMHGGHHGPSSVISAASSYQQQQHGNHSAHMYNHLAERPHMDRQLLERQQMDRLQAMERQKQMERQLPMSRPLPVEFDRQFQYNHQPPPVPQGTQRPQPLYPRGNQDWSPNVNAGRQRNFSYQEDDMLLKKRQVEAQHRLMQQENSRRVHVMPQQGVYHADSLQHLHTLPSHSSANDGSWGNPHRHPYNYHSIDHTHDQHHMGHVGPYLHQSGGRHSYSAAPSGRDLLGPPPSSMHPHHHQQQFQQRHRVPHHSGYGQQPPPPPPNHEQPDKKNYSVIQV